MKLTKRQSLHVKSQKGKEHKVKAKPIHRRALKHLAENGGNARKALLASGYSQVMANNPKRVLESKGFRVALEEAGLGLEDLNVFLAEDIRKKPQKRFLELQLAYKLHGVLLDKQQLDVTSAGLPLQESLTNALIKAYEDNN